MLLFNFVLIHKKVGAESGALSPCPMPTPLAKKIPTPPSTRFINLFEFPPVVWPPTSLYGLHHESILADFYPNNGYATE